MLYKKYSPKSPISVDDYDKYLRLKQIIGQDGKIPISRSKFYSDIKNGVYPSPIKLGRVSVWRASDIYDAIENAAKKGGNKNV